MSFNQILLCPLHPYFVYFHCDPSDVDFSFSQPSAVIFFLTIHILILFVHSFNCETVETTYTIYATAVRKPAVPWVVHYCLFFGIVSIFGLACNPVCILNHAHLYTLLTPTDCVCSSIHPSTVLYGIFVYSVHSSGVIPS